MLLTRRDLLRLAGLSSLAIFAPRFGRWYRRGSGLVVPEANTFTMPAGEVVWVRQAWTADDMTLRVTVSVDGGKTWRQHLTRPYGHPNSGIIECSAEYEIRDGTPPSIGILTPPTARISPYVHLLRSGAPHA